jgi:DNA-binding PadR family transcriptional regulator
MEFKPEYYAVLESLSTGARSASEVSSITELERHDVEAILASLMGQGLVERRERGLLLKREVYVLTERGWEVLHKWRERVRELVSKAAELREEGRVEEADALIAPIQSVLPLLLALGVLDAALYAAALGAVESTDTAEALEGAEDLDSLGL